ncbi:Elongation factor P--(R)-beta-lysine ligase [Planctomycetes bacterium CA13]|uniref:Elongation factor P--(R)-beta-lysine ligase n=1 Tax=Novipirellula herctigrandis TaxID=2527986 RepID=A0A5C5Z5P2_9BACT|nr:Elongation factor P--(R)-beta-lysine ligase [Planctomycetes bacterium CA13]
MRSYQVPDITLLRQRAALLRCIRTFFDDRGFFEVQPPCLASDCVVDPYIDPITIDADQFLIPSLDLPPRFYLQTSPELSMKRMLSAGAPSIYSVMPVFRAGERGEQHNIEFTMLEWYDVGANMESGIETLGTLVATVLGATRFDCVTYRTVFQAKLGFDPISIPLNSLASKASEVDHELSIQLRDDRDALLDLLFTHKIQPELGIDVPIIVKQYPLSQAALARVCEKDPQCAARFELFSDGVELANGYDELLDADVLLDRSRVTNHRRVESGRQPIPIETSLVAAMRKGMPPSTGVAMGVDRLLMVKTKTKSIDKVHPFPIERS